MKNTIELAAGLIFIGLVLDWGVYMVYGAICMWGLAGCVFYYGVKP
jgi:hypothetical protein